MNHRLVATTLGAALLLAACTTDEPTASRPSPDMASRNGCVRVASEVEQKNLFWAMSHSAGLRASQSTDVEVSAAGRELATVAEKAGRLDVTSHGKADLTEVEAQIAAARQKLMTACRGLLGEPPWQ